MEGAMKATRAVVAGLIGTAAMTSLLLIEPSIGLPEIAMGQILSTALGLAPAYVTPGPVLGWVIDFLVGSAFAFLYVATLERQLWGKPVVRGITFGVLVFVLAQLVFMPMVGGGVFSRGDVQLIAGSLLGHVVYGATVGWICGFEPARRVA
jgi:large-conductance mechanosensitive channel